ncbi:MAG: hypothetical protein HY934_07945 [Candidatus Firestonebacteria bacterium]|nr:hypothetical protein [Candidatus Firestonebacteria bacterium]
MIDFLFVFIFGAVIGWYFTRKLKSLQRVQIVHETDQNYSNALNAIVDKDYEKAQKLLMDTIDNDPDNIMAYQRLAELKFNHGNYVKALKIFEIITMRSFISKESSALAYRWYGKTAEKLKKYDIAIDAYNRVLNILPLDIESLKALESLYETNKNWNKALSYTKKIEEITNKDNKMHEAYLLFCKAQDNFNAGNLKDAEKSAEEAIEKDELCIPAYIIMGDILFKKEEKKEAKKNWDKVLEIKPDLGYLVFKRLEKFYFENDEYEKMRFIYEQLLTSNPKNAITHAALGNLFYNMENYDKAQIEYKESFQNGYFTKEILQNFFKICKKENRFNDFIIEIEMIINNVEKDFKNRCSACQYTDKDYFWKCPLCGKMSYYA